MGIVEMLESLGFVVEQTGGGCEAMVLRRKDYTYVATTFDGGCKPDDGDWFICEYHAGDWEIGEETVRSFSHGVFYPSDIAALLD